MECITDVAQRLFSSHLVICRASRRVGEGLVAKMKGDRPGWCTYDFNLIRNAHRLLQASL